MLNETPTLAPDGLPYRLLTLRNRAGMVVTLMDWGATLLSARVPMPDGSVRETLLGCSPYRRPAAARPYYGFVILTVTLALFPLIDPHVAR